MTGERETTRGIWQCIRVGSRPARLLLLVSVVVGYVLALSPGVQAETCFTASDMDAATRSALENTAKRYFEMASRGDTASVRQNSIPRGARNLSGIEAALKAKQVNFTCASV